MAKIKFYLKDQAKVAKDTFLFFVSATQMDLKDNQKSPKGKLNNFSLSQNLVKLANVCRGLKNTKIKPNHIFDCGKDHANFRHSKSSCCCVCGNVKITPIACENRQIDPAKIQGKTHSKSMGIISWFLTLFVCCSGAQWFQIA